jgi:hypothetical protein
MSAPLEGSASSHLDLGKDAEMRQALVKLRECYLQARELGSTFEPHANLEWILGARRSPTQDPLAFETSTIAVVALWLQDLAIELDRRAPASTMVERQDEALSAHEARRAMAQTLREATERFLTAFERQVG